MITFVNQAFEDITGYARSEAMGRTSTFLHGPDTDPGAIANIAAGLAARAPFRQELVHYTRAGAVLWIELDMIPIRDPAGRLAHWVSIERNVTARKMAEQHIHRLAYFDALTGLPNRSLLMDRIDAALAQASRVKLLGTLAFIYLDNFKKINDARGHAIGDVLLQLVAQRLADVVREEDTVARLGGDEFVILMPAMSRDAGEAARMGLAVADQVRKALSGAFTVDGQADHSGASLGITVLRGDGQSAHDLLREADTAMYCAKKGGRNRAALFEPVMQTEVALKLALEHDLAQAFAQQQLSVYVQTQVDQFGRPAGAEFLLRWRHPVRGFVPPAQFVPIAEESGMILELGAWVLEQAGLTLARCGEEGNTLPISINVSPRQFRQADFVRQVERVLIDTGAPPAQLIFEVTEGLLIDNLEETIGRMAELAALGIRFSIDDFGTGYSSLAYLKRLPLHELKIDKSFVHDTPHDVNDTAIVQLVLSMARHLGLRVVAEGVETQEQAQFLVAHGCHILQGYLYSPAAVGTMAAHDVATDRLRRICREFVSTCLTGVSTCPEWHWLLYNSRRGDCHVSSDASGGRCQACRAGHGVFGRLRIRGAAGRARRPGAGALRRDRARRRGARPDAARPRRHGGVPPAARDQRGADPDPDGARRFLR